MSYKYTKDYNTKKTPQNQPIPGSKQVRNSAGGFSFELDKWDRLDRFLILGSESGSYYASPQKLTRENAKNLEKCIRENGVKVVNRVVEISTQGRAPKNDPALFALAMCSAFGDVRTRRAAYEALNSVARTGTHLFTLVGYREDLAGWGRGFKKAVSGWYNSKTPEKLSYQVIKYRQRGGWSHKDVLRLAHPQAATERHNQIFEYVTKGTSAGVFEDDSEDALWTIWAAEEAKVATTAKQIVKLIADYNLPREAIPTEFLNNAEVWDALLQKMPMTATIRNLGNMSKVGLLVPMSKASKIVCDRLTNEEQLKGARVHPLNVLVALNTYHSGHGVRGSGTWEVVQPVVDALDKAFYKSFKYVEPTGKNIMLALDVSGSMWSPVIAGMPGITPHIGAAAMSLVTASVEQNYHIMGFSTRFTPLAISPRMRLDSVVKVMENTQMGGTDCAIPMLHAKKNNMHVDTFVIYTDSESWAGNIHPIQALDQYKQHMGINSKLIVVGMVPNNYSIGGWYGNRAERQEDARKRSDCLDVVGFDTATPAIMSDFIRD